MLLPPSSTPSSHPRTPLPSLSPSGIKIDPHTPRPAPGRPPLSVLIAESRSGSRESSKVLRAAGQQTTSAPSVRRHRRSQASSNTHTRPNSKGNRRHHSDCGSRCRPLAERRFAEPGQPSPPTSESAPLLGQTRHSSRIRISPPSLGAGQIYTAPSHAAAHLFQGFLLGEMPRPSFASGRAPGNATGNAGGDTGLLLNILDGVSYGMIIFPATGIFAGFWRYRP